MTSFLCKVALHGCPCTRLSHVLLFVAFCHYHSAKSKQLDENQFAYALCQCILQGMERRPELHRKYPSAYDKLVAVFAKMGFHNRRDLRAVMHARGFGTPVSGALVAAIMSEPDAVSSSKPPPPPISAQSFIAGHRGAGNNASVNDDATMKRSKAMRRSSIEARMRLISTPGSDLVDEVLATPKL